MSWLFGGGMASPRREAGLIEALFSGVCAAFASWTMLTQIALVLGLSLHTLFATYSAALGVGGLAAALWLRRGGFRLRPVDPLLSGLLASTALACGFISLAVIKPNPDDVNYAARAVYFLAHPGLPLDLAFHDHAFFDAPLTYPLLLTYTGELFWAYVAWLLQIDFLDAYHLIAPFVGGTLIPLAWTLAIGRIVPSSRAAVLGAVAVSAYLCSDGYSLQGFGNYAFVRIWHGKVLLLSLGLPLFTAFALEWLERPRPSTWSKLFLVAVCASGLTSTALFLLPLLALALGVGHLAARGPSRRAFLETLGLGASLVHGVVLGLALRMATNPADYRYLGFGVGFPVSFAGQLDLVFPSQAPIAIASFTVSVLACLALLDSRRRRFLLGWILAIVVLALNPLMMPVVVEHLSTYNAYWRVFYALPFPLTFGTAVALLAEQFQWSTRAVVSAAGVLVAGAAAVNALAPSASTLGTLRFDPGSYKLRAGLWEEVREIEAHAAPGSMLAPHEISVTLPLLSSDFPQVSVESYFVKHFARLQGQPEVGESRHGAALYAAGRNPAGLPDVTRLLDRGVQNLVVARDQSTDTRLLVALQRRGYRRALDLERFVLFRRADNGAAAR